MKVIHVQYVEGIAGSERFILQISKEFKLRGIDSQFICIFHPQNEERISGFLNEFEKSGLKVHTIRTNKKISFKLIFAIRKILNFERPDLVQTHLLHSDLYLSLLLLLRLASCKVVSIKHGYKEAFLINYFNGLKKKDFSIDWIVSRFSYLMLNHTYTISKSFSKFFYDQGITNSEINVVYHGIKLKGALNLNGCEISRPFICVVGRLEKIKGHIHMLNAFSMIAKKNKSLMLYVIGEGGERRTLENYCKENNLSERVVFTGFVQNPEEYTSKAIIVVVPSLIEPFGLIVLEAQAQNTPVIGFDIPALNEIIIDNETGLLVPAYNAVILYEKIVNLLDNESYRRKLSNSAYQRLTNSFSIDKMIDNTLKEYSIALNS